MKRISQQEAIFLAEYVGVGNNRDEACMGHKQMFKERRKRYWRKWTRKKNNWMFNVLLSFTHEVKEEKI